MKSKIGIAVAANNIEQSVVKRFEQSAKKTLEENDELCITQGTIFGPFNKSRHINDALRILIDKGCDIIVQTDIDVEFSKLLFEETRSVTKPGIHFWTPLTKEGIVWKTGVGSWNALCASDWLKTGGFDERFFGWGGEDNDLHRRCRELEITLLTGWNHPAHIDHGKREHWHAYFPFEETDRNTLEIAQNKNYVNYLTDTLPEQKGITLHLTSRCQKRCRECCMQDFMKLEPSYIISEKEIDDLIQAIEMNPYDVHHLVLCGGEPLLCPTLPYAIDRFNSCKKIREIWLFTGLVEGFNWQNLPKIRGSIRFSIYQDNEALIHQALKQGIVPECIDKRQHTILPHCLHPESIPGKCYNPEIFVYQGRVYTCPMAAQNLLRYNIAHYQSLLYSEPLTNRLFDRMRGWKTGAMLPCTGCAGNTNFQTITGRI
jgi:hypothetical protein